MSNTTSISPVQTSPAAPISPVQTAAPTPPIAKTHSVGWYFLQGLKALASLRLTVVLFVLSLLLVFFGTLAQIDNGTWSVVSNYFRWFWVWVPFKVFSQFGGVFLEFLGFPKGLTFPGSFPFPGGLTLGVLLLVNLLAAHAVRFKLTWKRSGIFLIHGGLILMLLGEFIAYFSVEGNMRIEEGETADTVIIPRKYELAIVRPDGKDSKNDRITVVPGRMLTSKGETISNEELPFDITVVKWLVNARLRKPGGQDNPATEGYGVQRIAVEQGEVSGVASEQTMELPACYLELKKKDGASLGTWLMALGTHPQPVTVDGKTYDVSLRFKTSYKPYSLQLLEFRFDRYPGTKTPKNFSSKVRLVDAETGDDREVTIKMNSPLYHRGETFYQADYNKDTERGTVLQVVRNPGWMLPYFSCLLVSLGMALHFGLNLATFLQKEGRIMNAAARYVPWIVVGLAGLYLIGMMAPRSDPESKMNLKGFSALPVQDRGRIKPIDTYARVQLMLISNRQEYTDENNNSGQPATRWLLNLLADGTVADETKVRVSDPQVLEWLNLPNRPRGFDPDDVLSAAMEKRDELLRLAKAPKDQRTPVEEKVLRTVESSKERKDQLDEFRDAQKKMGRPRKIRTFRIENDQVRAMLGLESREGLRYSFEEITGNRDSSDAKDREQALRFAQFFQKAAKANEREENQRDLVDVKVLELFSHLRIYSELGALAVAMVPPVKGDKWQMLDEAMTPEVAESNPAADSLAKIVHAYASNNVKAFNKEVAAYQKQLVARGILDDDTREKWFEENDNRAWPDDAGLGAGSLRRVRLEVWFNQFSPFYRCIGLYVLVFLLACFSWVIWPDVLRPSAFYLGITVAVVHTAALLLRMYIQNRPPVTNLYSSAVFIGWGCVLLCLAIEWWYRNGIGAAVAAGLGFSTLIIAHHLGGSGDTLEMMQAVLDTNFWLATHVTTVTLGYAATFGAGFIATAYLWRMLATAVVAFFKNKGQPGWTNPLVFGLALFGLAFIPALVALVALGGLSYVFFPDEVHLLVTLFAVALCLGAAVYVGVVGIQWAAGSQHGGRPTDVKHAPVELPTEARWLENVVLTAGSSKTLAGVVYGVVCFATMLSFIGTVLGGIWADYSWGRFWGWDPKENGAILIVIMNALVLHARWGGMIKERGLVALTIVGNMVTMWSWFGTNQLGIGLHAYGFNKALVLMCSCFWGSQLILLGITGLLPLRYWRSYSELAGVKLEKAPATVKPAPRTGGLGSTGIVPAS